MPACWRWGTGPSCPTSCPRGWEHRAGLGQRCLFQVSRAGWRAPCLCWQGGSRAGARGRMSLAPCAFSRPGCGSLQRVGIPLGPVAGTGGGCSWRGFSGRGVGEMAPLCTLAGLPRWQSLAGGHSAVTAGGAWCSHRGGCSSRDAAPPALGSACACQPGAVDVWAPSCAHLIPPAPMPGPPCPAQRCQKHRTGFSSGRALCFSVPALKSLAVFYWCFANESEGAASAGCAVGRALAAGSRWDAGNRRTHLGATWEPASSRCRPHCNSSPPVLDRAAPGASGETGLGTVGRTRRWRGLGGPSPTGSPGERRSRAAGG